MNIEVLRNAHVFIYRFLCEFTRRDSMCVILLSIVYKVVIFWRGSVPAAIDGLLSQTKRIKAARDLI